MSEFQYLIFVAPFAVTALVIFALKYGSAAFQAHARGAAEAAYRDVAQRAVDSQSEANARLAALQAELAEVSKSLAAVVKILQAVE
jgi:signal transduction histidine kinase